ncbi:DUF3307 domain-containing protein [Streptomyces sp. NPDC090054]|uniref:DUF3307 domain-containing protein n=1 Tax=Streptomyces sp. NPDC090054 TaxID=3365933 RepID=UPI00380CAEB4
MFANLFVLLYVAHLIADYALQTDHQADHKMEKSREGWTANLTHAGTHTMTTAVALAIGWWALDLPISLPAAGTALAWITASHALIDRRWPVTWWMTNTGSTDWISRGGAAYVDQTAHVTALAIAALGMAAI